MTPRVVMAARPGGGADDGGPGAEGDTVDSEIRELLDEVASESSG